MIAKDDIKQYRFAPLSVIFRAKYRDSLKKTELYEKVNGRVWNKEWVMHSEAVGSGEAAFKYLALYVFRVAISNSRIVKLEAGRVPFKYKDSATDQQKLSTVSAEEFIRRFLQARAARAIRETEILRIACCRQPAFAR